MTDDSDDIRDIRLMVMGDWGSVDHAWPEAVQDLLKEYDRLTAENEKLREALTAAKGGLEWASGIMPSTHSRDMAWVMAQNADAALKGDGE